MKVATTTRHSIQIRNFCVEKLHIWSPTEQKVAHFLNDRKKPGYWRNANNHRLYFDWLFKELNLRSMDDWYSVKLKTVMDYGGSGFMGSYYKKSLSYALKILYPEYPWASWKFNKKPDHALDSVDTQRELMQAIGKDLNIDKLDDWYKYSSLDVMYRGGRPVLRRYKSSLFHTLQALFPDHPWDLMKFPKLPQKYSNSPAYAAKYIEELSQMLHIQTLDDWYRVSIKQIQDCGSKSITLQSQLVKLLQKVYPDHPWDLAKFRNRGKRSEQRWLKLLVSRMFPGEEVLEEYNHPEMSFPVTQRSVQLDIFVPKLKLAFEYLGEQHYKNIFYFGPQNQVRLRDEYKKEACKEANITLIEVPYWWDKQEHSLMQQIKLARPELFEQYEPKKSS